MKRAVSEFERGIAVAAEIARSAAAAVMSRPASSDHERDGCRTRQAAAAALLALADVLVDDNQSVSAPAPPPAYPSSVAERQKEARAKGYAGEACPECANFTLVRNGTCLKCDTCGATTGCS